MKPQQPVPQGMSGANSNSRQREEDETASYDTRIKSRIRKALLINMSGVFLCLLVT